MKKLLRAMAQLHRDARGSVLVEFAVACLLFLLIICGIIDMGLAFYTKQVMTNASREGARYGVVYVVDPTTGSRVAPANFTASDIPSRPSTVAAVATNYLSNNLPSNASTSVSVSGDGSTTQGSQLIVTVTGTYTWLVLDNFIPGFGNSMTMTAKTVMLLE